MEQVRHIHNCILFKIGEIRYLYGLTYSYLFSSKFLKYKPHFLIIPSKAYINKIFMQFGFDQLLKILGCSQQKQSTLKTQNFLFQFGKQLKGIIVCSQKIFDEYKYCKPESINFIMLQDKPEEHSLIVEEKLINIHKQQINEMFSGKVEGKNQAPLEIPKWLGQPIDELKIMVSKQDSSILLCLGMDLISVDPGQNIFHILNAQIIGRNWQIQLSTDYTQNSLLATKIYEILDTIIITKISSIPALLTLLLVSFKKNVYKHIKVIVLDPIIEKLILDSAWRFLYLNEQIVRQRFFIRILQPNFRYPLLINKQLYQSKTSGELVNNTTTNLMVKFHSGNQQYYPHLNIEFGSTTNVTLNKSIVFYGISVSSISQKWQNVQIQTEFDSLQLTKLPKNISTLQYLIVNRIEEQLLKMMKTLPVLLRKKIIYNRLQNKYNHKYFVTLQQKVESTIQSIKMSGVEIMTGPRHSKKFRGELEEKLDSKEVILDFLLNRNLFEFRVFDDMTYLGDYVTVFNNYSNFTQKSLNVPKPNPSKLTQNKIGFGTIFQESQKINKIILGDSEIVPIGKRWKITLLSQYQRINLKNTAVYVISGMGILLQSSKKQAPYLQLVIKNQFLQVKTDSVEEYSIFIGIKDCTIGVMSLSNFLTSNPRFNEQSLQIKEEILSDVQNSFIKNGNITPFQLSILNRIGKKETYEIGNKMNYKRNQKIFFVSKGALKWNQSQKVAASGFFIGDMTGYYQQKKIIEEQRSLHYKDDKSENKAIQKHNSEHNMFIQVIKDTWVVECNIDHFHEEFAKIFPHKIFQIFDKNQLFN